MEYTNLHTSILFYFLTTTILYYYTVLYGTYVRTNVPILYKSNRMQYIKVVIAPTIPQK